MVDIKADWVDNTGEQVNAAYLNGLGVAVNLNTHAVPQFGTLASQPAAGNAGLIYYCTDCDSIYRDNGTSWVRIRFGDSVGPAIGDVPTTGWTALNMLGASSWAADRDGMLFTASTSQSSIGYQYRTYPTPPFTLIAYLDAVYPSILGIPGNANSALFSGIIVSDGTKYINLGAMSANASGSPWINGDGWYVGAAFWSIASVFSSAYNGNFSPQTFIGKMPKWFRYIDDGTNRMMAYSANGLDWTPVVTEARTTNLTPTRIGIGAVHTGTGTAAALIRVRSWNGVS
jgi:hypothetical protein